MLTTHEENTSLNNTKMHEPQNTHRSVTMTPQQRKYGETDSAKVSKNRDENWEDIEDTQETQEEQTQEEGNPIHQNKEKAEETKGNREKKKESEELNDRKKAMPKGEKKQIIPSMEEVHQGRIIN